MMVMMQNEAANMEEVIKVSIIKRKTRKVGKTKVNQPQEELQIFQKQRVGIVVQPVIWLVYVNQHVKENLKTYMVLQHT
jgi:hypothetical protein